MTNYPTDIIDDDGRWGRVHKGHGLDRAVLEADLTENSPGADGDVMQVSEVWFAYRPRVKWCGNWTMGCDSEGDWHSHWFTVRPAAGFEFTTAYWKPPTPDREGEHGSL